MHTKEPWHWHNEKTYNLAGKGSFENGDILQCRMRPSPANATRIVSCVNALAGLNPDAVRSALTAFEAITVAARLEKMSLVGPAWRDLLETCEQARKNLKGE